MRSRLGVCYYPEHWPRDQWAAQARAMRELGLELVRIGEFSWAEIEPAEGRFDWGWLDAAIDTLAAAGLGVVLGTPTACPPQWLIERYPDVLPIGADGRPRRFGSRRHYRFWSDDYRRESLRIVTAMAERYGGHPAIVGWQTDNEYGCHETTASYGDDDRRAFRRWLAGRYGSIERLNEAWGTAFWSQTYPSFDAVDLPVGTVTEANPAHRLAFRRFASEGVERFNREQVDVLRRHSRDDVWISHNFMGDFTEFDHYAVGRALDVAAWDSYPLGFLDQGRFSANDKARYRRTGHPDWAAFHHDLYRAVGNGRFGVMEQQPGAVNWAPHNALPLDGMVRLWTLEAIAHGAEFVSYFRWRQFPAAQEQFHAALTLSDGSPAAVRGEVQQCANELELLGELPGTGRADVALVYDYESVWVTDIQPQCAGFDAHHEAQRYYRAARRLGLDVDIVAPTADLDGYRVVLVAAAYFESDTLVANAEANTAHWLLAPRTAQRTGEFALPDNLPPGGWQRHLPARMTAVDALRPGADLPFDVDGQTFRVRDWFEQLDTDVDALASLPDGRPVWLRQGRFDYLAGVVDDALLDVVVAGVCRNAGIATERLPDGLRVRRRGELTFAINYGPDRASWAPHGAECVVGGAEIDVADVAIWRQPPE